MLVYCMDNWKRVIFADIRQVCTLVQKEGSSLQRAAMLSTLHAVHWICSRTLIYIHIYTSLVKICTLHITVHTSHQLLANTRTLMKPKTTALKQAGGLIFPSGKVSLGYTFRRDTAFQRGKRRRWTRSQKWTCSFSSSSNSC